MNEALGEVVAGEPDIAQDCVSGNGERKELLAL